MLASNVNGVRAVKAYALNSPWSVESCCALGALSAHEAHAACLLRLLSQPLRLAHAAAAVLPCIVREPDSTPRSSHAHPSQPASTHGGDDGGGGTVGGSGGDDGGDGRVHAAGQPPLRVAPGGTAAPLGQTEP